MPPSPAFCPPLAFHSRTAHPFSPPLAMAPHHAIMPPCRLSSALTFPVYMPISSTGPGAPGGNAVQCVLASLQLAWGAALSKCSVNTGWWKDRRTGKGRNEQQHSKIRLGETASVGGQRPAARPQQGARVGMLKGEATPPREVGNRLRQWPDTWGSVPKHHSQRSQHL